MLVGPGETPPPLSAYPKEVQETWRRIILNVAKRKVAREADKRKASESAEHQNESVDEMD